MELAQSVEQPSLTARQCVGTLSGERWSTWHLFPAPLKKKIKSFNKVLLCKKFIGGGGEKRIPFGKKRVHQAPLPFPP